MARVCVVIPNHNGGHLLRECLDALDDQTFTDFEVLVVDNGSTDGSPQLVRDRPRVQMIALPANRGFPAAVNAGISASSAPLVVLLNNDTRAEADWLEHLVAAMDEVRGASMAASKIVYRRDPGVLDAAGDRYSMTRLAGVAIGRGERPEAHDEPVWVFGASAAAAIYRRSLFDDIGLFDEDFFLLHEDVDLDLRAQLAGHACLYVPGAVVQHHHGATRQQMRSQIAYLTVRNRLWVAVKGLPAPLLVLALLASSLRLPVVVFGALARGRAAGAGEGAPRVSPAAVARGVWDGLLLAWPKRAGVQSRRRVSQFSLLLRLLRARSPLRARPSA